MPDVVKEAVFAATPYVEGRSIDLDINPNETKVMSYVKDRLLVDIGTFCEKPIETVKILIQIRLDN